MAVLITMASIIAAVYVGFSLLLFLTQSRVLYQPSRVYDYNPKGYGLQYEVVSLVTPDGESLAAWFVPARVPTGPFFSATVMRAISRIGWIR